MLEHPSALCICKIRGNAHNAHPKHRRKHLPQPHQAFALHSCPSKQPAQRRINIIGKNRRIAIQPRIHRTHRRRKHRHHHQPRHTQRQHIQTRNSIRRFSSLGNIDRHHLGVKQKPRSHRRNKPQERTRGHQHKAQPRSLLRLASILHQKIPLRRRKRIISNHILQQHRYSPRIRISPQRKLVRGIKHAISRRQPHILNPLKQRTHAAELRQTQHPHQNSNGNEDKRLQKIRSRHRPATANQRIEQHHRTHHHNHLLNFISKHRRTENRQTQKMQRRIQGLHDK